MTRREYWLLQDFICGKCEVCKKYFNGKGACKVLFPYSPTEEDMEHVEEHIKKLPREFIMHRKEYMPEEYEELKKYFKLGVKLK